MKAEIYTAQAAMQCNMKERRQEDGVTGRVPRLAGERQREKADKRNLYLLREGSKFESY